MCISERMTRVWEAGEVASVDNLTPLSDMPVVLKDVWIDRGAQTERQIQSMIFGDIEKFKDDLGTNDPHFSEFDAHMEKQIRSCLTNQGYKKYFLEIICDHQGYVSKSRMSSHSTHEGAMQNRTHGDPTRHHSRVATPTSQATPRPFASQHQYRVVFKELCKPPHRMECNPGDASMFHW
jgi:hypothetical protein